MDQKSSIRFSRRSLSFKLATSPVQISQREIKPGKNGAPGKTALTGIDILETLVSHPGDGQGLVAPVGNPFRGGLADAVAEKLGRIAAGVIWHKFLQDE